MQHESRSIRGAALEQNEYFRPRGRKRYRPVSFREDLERAYKKLHTKEGEEEQSQEPEGKNGVETPFSYISFHEWLTKKAKYEIGSRFRLDTKLCSMFSSSFGHASYQKQFEACLRALATSMVMVSQQKLVASDRLNLYFHTCHCPSYRMIRICKWKDYVVVLDLTEGNSGLHGFQTLQDNLFTTSASESSVSEEKKQPTFCKEVLQKLMPLAFELANAPQLWSWSVVEPEKQHDFCLTYSLDDWCQYVCDTYAVFE